MCAASHPAASSLTLRTTAALEAQVDTGGNFAAARNVNFNIWRHAMVASQMPTSEEWIMLHYPYCPVVKFRVCNLRAVQIMDPSVANNANTVVTPPSSVFTK